jgi:hypothetical protein
MKTYTHVLEEAHATKSIDRILKQDFSTVQQCAHSRTLPFIYTLTEYILMSKTQQSLSARLAADIHHIVAVSEAVEASSRALGVCAHVLEIQPVTNIQQLGEGAGRGDDVNAIAGGTPDGVLDLRWGIVAGAAHVVQDIVAGLQHLRDRVLMVEDDAGEVAIDSVVKVQHVVGGAESGISDGTAGNDVARNGERSRDIVASRLANHTNVRREVLIQGSGQDCSHGFKGRVTSEATTDVQGVHVEAEGSRLVKDEAGVLHSFDEGFGVGCARADVESNANNVELELLRKLQQLAGLVHCGTKLLAQTAQAGCIVGDDTQIQLSIGEELLGLVELIGIVEGHLLHASVGSVANIRLGLAWLRVDDAGGVDADLENRLNFVLRSAIEAEAELGHETQNLWIRVALDGCGHVS